MKKFFMGILSLSTLFIFSSITYASEPSEDMGAEKTPSAAAFMPMQSSEHLMGNARRHVRRDSSLDLSSSSEVVGVAFGDASTLSEEQGSEVSNTETDEGIIFIDEDTGSPSYADAHLVDSEDAHPLQKLLESSKRGWQ